MDKVADITDQSSKIDILLATYNGEKFLEQQLDSLLKQDYDNWHLFIRDDGSAAATLNIIRQYKERYPNKVTVISDTRGNLGPAGSFSVLMQESVADYIAFCDQDDVWMPNKLSIQLRAMKEAEEQCAAGCPVLVHSDLVVVDEKLRVMSESFWKHQNLDPQGSARINNLLVQNFVTGCTCLINRPLVDLVGYVPDRAIMHDWWIALVAVLTGKIVSLSEPTVKYRQHGSNDTGAIKWGWEYIYAQVSRGTTPMRQSLLRTRDQADALLKAGFARPDQNKTIEAYVRMFNHAWLMRKISLVRYGFRKKGMFRNLALLFII